MIVFSESCRLQEFDYKLDKMAYQVFEYLTQKDHKPDSGDIRNNPDVKVRVRHASLIQREMKQFLENLYHYFDGYSALAYSYDDKKRPEKRIYLEILKALEAYKSL